MKFSKKCISVFVASLIITTSLGINVSATTTLPQKDNNTKKLMNEYMNELKKQYPFNGAVLVSQKGKIIFRQAYGKADFEKNIPNTPDTKFSIASVSKQFTAVGIMILQERGELNVKEPISNYLPDYPNGDKITIENLLTHTSGLAEYLTNELLTSNASKNKYTPEEIITLFKDKPSVFETGTKFKYCNSNYILLGSIIEKVSGMKYEDFLTNNIFKPLKMKNTGFYLDTSNTSKKSNAYLRSNTGAQNVITTKGYINHTLGYAAGGMYSTLDDLYLWHRALSDEKILTKESLAQVYKEYLPGSNYGYGVGLDVINGQKCIAHMGTMPGVNTIISRYIDEDTCIVVLSNLAQIDVDKIQSNLYSILHEGKYEKPKQFTEVSIDPQILDSYTGKYEFSPGVSFEIVKKDSSLFLVTDNFMISPNETNAIYPCSQTRFFHKVENLNIEFKDISNGKAQNAMLNVGDSGVEFKRIN